jgi:hypothetical protein
VVWHQGVICSGSVVGEFIVTHSHGFVSRRGWVLSGRLIEALSVGSLTASGEAFTNIDSDMSTVSVSLCEFPLWLHIMST